MRFDSDAQPVDCDGRHKQDCTPDEGLSMCARTKIRGRGPSLFQPCEKMNRSVTAAVRIAPTRSSIVCWSMSPSLSKTSRAGVCAVMVAVMSVSFHGAPTIDPDQLADLKDRFPKGSKELDAIAGLLAQPPTSETVNQLFTAMREFSLAVGVESNDGEADPSKEPGMLDEQRPPEDVFTKFADGLVQAGVDFGDSDGGGELGLGDFAAKALHGAKEALRQLTYWQMKNRAGVVGQKGLGSAIDRLAEEFPNLRIHLIGHSFGGRLVSFALAGIRESSHLRSNRSPCLMPPTPGSTSRTTCRSAVTAHWTARWLALTAH